MADDPTNWGGQDRDRFNVNQPHEVAYSTTVFGVAGDQLRQA